MDNKTTSQKREEIDNYINKRYPRWLDYSNFQCANAGLEGHGEDLLHEVLIKLLEKDMDLLWDLLQKRRDHYCDLDFFLLRIIKLNAISKTAPYKYKLFTSPTSGNSNSNKDVFSLKIIDEGYDNAKDKKELICEQMEQLRNINPSVLTLDERAVLDWLLFEDLTPIKLSESGFKIHQIYKLKKSMLQKLKTHFQKSN